MYLFQFLVFFVFFFKLVISYQTDKYEFKAKSKKSEQTSMRPLRQVTLKCSLWIHTNPSGKYVPSWTHLPNVSILVDAFALKNKTQIKKKILNKGGLHDKDKYNIGDHSNDLRHYIAEFSS